MEPEKILQCPVCLDTMTRPIIQCQVGHSMCGNCITANSLKLCPQCRKPLSNTRNYQLEQLIENMDKCLRVQCFYAPRGCKFQISPKEKDDHELECRYRNFRCEGDKFAKWNCKFSGSLEQVYDHFKKTHPVWSDYKTDCTRNVDLTKDSYDVQMISFFNGANYFWYKHKVNTAKSKVYFVIQFVGTRKQSSSFYYEFEVHDRSQPVRKFKITEICASDTANVEELFDKEKCVAMSFETVRNFLKPQTNELAIKFRIMSLKKSH